MAEIRNTFTDGMVRDSLESLSNDKTYRIARNAIHQSRDASNFGLVNEESTFLAASMSGTIKGKSHISERNQTLVFVYNGASEIWLFNHTDNSTTFVCSDQEFGCDWGFDGCEFLYAEFKSFNKCNELHAYWSSDCIYHVVNLDEMLDDTRKASVIACEDCTYFDVFKATCGPHLSALPSYNAGSTMESGVVQFAVQFKDNNGNTSNVFDISQPVIIPSPDNIAGQPAKASAKLRIDGLDKTWNDVVVYVIHTVGDITNIKKMSTASYGENGFTFEYYGQKGQELVDISVLINKNKAWLRGQDLIQKDGRMFFYNIKNERNLNYQKYANNIQIEWVEYEVSMEQQLKYHYPSLLRGEVYAIGIVWKFLDGTYSPVYHIPGCGGVQSGGVTGGDDGVQTFGINTASQVESERNPGNAINVYSKPIQYCGTEDGDCVECNYCDECNPCTPPGKGATGPTAGGGGSAEAAASDTYNPIQPSDLNTSEQFERKRNPTEVKDRPNESDKFENQTRTDINNISAREEDYVNVSECLACTRECWCKCCDGCSPSETQTCTTVDPANPEVIVEEMTCITVRECPPGEEEECDCSVVPRVVAADLPDISNVGQNNAELIARFGRDYPDPDVNQTGNLHDAAVFLVDNAVIEREYITRRRPILNYGGVTQAGPGGSPTDPVAKGRSATKPFTQQGVGISTVESVIGGSGGSNRGDNWVDSAGNPVTEEPPREVASGSTTPYISSVQYPDDKDCDGNFFYPQGSICHHQIPWASERPHFVSFQNGVTNKYQPHNYEFGKTYTRPMGLRVTNIKFPDQDELPKPLCPKSPFKIVYVQRTDQNKSIFAKGWLKGIFQGEVYGETHAYPRHGVNSFEHVDRFIAAGDGTSRMGTQSTSPIYTFHSPDTDCDNSFLPVTKCRSELAMLGSGWMHGLWSEGKKPEVDQWSGTRIDNSGARLSNNFNHYTAGGAEADIVGLTYAPGNTVVTPASGMSLPLMNRFRPSSVYLETSGNMPGDELDESFVGGVRDHFGPTTCNAPYVALHRPVPDQYGSVEGLKYIDLGLVATTVHAQGGNAIEGICGDVWIGPYTKRDTSYVSNKVGNFFNPPAKPGSPCRERSACDSPDDKIFQYFGIDHYPTKLPKSGDRWDPKNYQGLHTVAGDCGAYGLSKTHAESAAAGSSESDFYGPKTCKSLNMTIVESHVNPWLRETGEGSQLQDGKVWYPKLKDLYLDADAPTGHPWEQSYLTRFYNAIRQPSVKQLHTKQLYRTLLNLIAPVGLMTQFQQMETVIDTVSTFVMAPMLMAIWILATNTLFTDRRLNQMLRIDDCRRDEEGGDLDENIENWEDNYCRYNWDYSSVNNIQPYYAFPLPFVTCDCDDCSKTQTNNLIYHSNKQNLDSDIDAYRNIKINNYGELPANAGRLQKLFIQGNGFYAHATDGIWLLKLMQESISNGIAFQQAGSGELLAEPQLLFEGVAEGFAGTQHPNAAINTAFGYFFIDDNAKKIYRFNGTPEEISAYGMYQFFKNKLGFCQPKACFDEKTSQGINYSLGWDPRYNRLLVTKRDGSDCNSFTASYTPLGIPTQGGGSRGKWISLHDYKPHDYLWDREKLYSIDYGTGQIWQHGKHGEYGVFHGKPYPFEVWFTAVGADLEAFDFEYLILDTEAELETDQEYPIKDVDLTFNKVAIWNSSEGTGTIDIIPVSDNFGQKKSQLDKIKSDYSKVKFNKKRRVWEANAIKNLVADDCNDKHMLTVDCECQPIPDTNEEIYDCSKLNKQDFKNRILSDKHLNYRYILDNRNDMRLYVKTHKTFDDKKIIPKQG